jgi:tetratricopeptide (TPR) repeat protein
MSIERWLALSRDLWAQEQYEEALIALAEGEADQPDAPELPALRAQFLNELGRYRDALEASRRALERNPQQADARFAQGLALFLLERLDEAETVLNALVADAPDYPNAAYLRAGLLRRTRGDLAPEVLAAYDLVRTVDPDNLFALSERADILRANGRYAEARDIYARLRSPALCPDEALRVEAAFNLGSVSLTLGDTETAREAFRAVLDAAPDYPDAQAMVDSVSTV